MSDLRDELERLVEREPPEAETISGELLIYGAGGCGQRLAAALRERGVIGFLDQRGDQLGTPLGLPVWRPEEGPKGYPVVVGVFNHSTDPETIRERLLQLGFTRVLRYVEAHELAYGQRASDYWLTGRGHAHRHRRELMALFDVLDDDASRETLIDWIALRVGAGTRPHRSPQVGNHYLAGGAPQRLRLLDGGAFVGDTLRQFVAQAGFLEAYAGFEPDMKNYQALVATASELKEKIGERWLFPCGLGAQAGGARFEAGRDGASGLSEEGTAWVQLVALDDALPDFQPTMIKLDVEGAEPAVLQGAGETIKKYQPLLAISIYHEPEHLWELPMQMHILLPDHRLRLVTHQYHGFDTVAYAVPRDLD